MFAVLHALRADHSVGINRTIMAIALVLLLGQATVATSAAKATSPLESGVITIEGTVFSPLTREMIGGANVEFIDSRTGQVIAETTSSAMGVFTIDLPFDGKPIEAYMRGSKDGFLTTLVFPPEALTHDIGDCPPFVHTNDCMNIALLTDAQADFMAGLAGVERDPAMGEVLFLAVGCDGRPVAGATIAIAPKPEVIAYTNGPFPNPSAEATDGSGRAFGFNMKPGRATIRVRYPDGSTGISHIRIEANAVSIASTFPQNAHCSR